MKTVISREHRSRLNEMAKSLAIIGSHEGSFLKIELLFFEALEIARSYGQEPQHNSLLESLNHLREDSYRKANEHFKKRSQRELCIRRFISQFRRMISGKASAIADPVIG